MVFIFILFYVVINITIVAVIIIGIVQSKKIERNRRNRIMRAQYQRQVSAMREKMEMDALTLRTYQKINHALSGANMEEPLIESSAPAQDNISSLMKRPQPVASGK